MSLDALNPPAPTPLSASRLATRREHLLEAIRLGGGRPSRLQRWFTGQPGPRRLALIVALALLVVGVGTALGVSVDLLARDVAFHKQFDRGQLSPQPASSFVYITRGSDWALIAWKSTRGICLDYVYEDKADPSGFNGGGGCGMPVVGSPADQVFKQPPNTDVVGWGIGSAGKGRSWTISGPTSRNVAKVQVEFRNGHLTNAPIYTAPAKLDTRLRFFLLRVSGPPYLSFHRAANGRIVTSPVTAVRAYDSAGKLLERKAVG